MDTTRRVQENKQAVKTSDQQKDSCSFFHLEVPIITVLYFQHLPDFFSKTVFLSPHFPGLHLRAGLECSVSQKIPSCIEGLALEAGLLKQLMNLTPQQPLFLTRRLLSPPSEVSSWQTFIL